MHICYEHEDTLGTKFIDINQQYILIRCKTYYLFLEFNVWPCFELWSRRPYPDLALRIQTGQDLWGQSSMHRLLSGICERRMAHSTNPCGGTREPSRLPFAPVWWISKTASCFWAVKYTSVHQNYTNSQKFLNSRIFNVFFKEFSSAHQACIYLIQRTAKTLTFLNIFTI